MKKSKRDEEQATTKEHILAVARRLFVEQGYDATSMSRVAEEAHVAPNTIYWHFADKDALLTSVLDALVAEAALEFQHRKPAPPDAQVMWLLGVFEGVQNLIATVHARLPASERVRDWHLKFHLMLEALLRAELHTHGVPEADLEPAARITMFVVEGLLAHPTSIKDRRALARWLTSKLEERRGSSPTT